MAKFKLTMAFFDDYINIQELTSLFKLDPSEAWQKGDAIKNHEDIFRKEACWEYSTELIDTPYFDEAVEDIKEKFYPLESIIIKYMHEKAIECKLDVLVEIYDNEPPALTLDVELMRFLSNINCKIDFDMYNI